MAPVEVTLRGDLFPAPAFPESVRRHELALNPRVALTSWDDAWHAPIVYGLVVPAESPPSVLAIWPAHLCHAPPLPPRIPPTETTVIGQLTTRNQQLANPGAAPAPALR